MLNARWKSSHGKPNNKIRNEIKLLTQRLTDAQNTIKHSSHYKRKGERAQYELPWYMVLGNQSSGKSSLLVHSGIDFPLKEKDSDSLNKTIAPTQHCDWYLANHAVFLDVGRSVH